jgi:hypothetical protein
LASTLHRLNSTRLPASNPTEIYDYRQKDHQSPYSTSTATLYNPPACSCYLALVPALPVGLAPDTYLIVTAAGPVPNNLDKL